MSTTLKLDTSSSPPHAGHGEHRSSSPVPPPMSPITPVLGPASVSSTKAATESLSPRSTLPTTDSTPPPPRVLTHSQPPQTFIPPPAIPPEPISLSSNPDAIALQSAISILQLQRMRATQDIETLQGIKQRALGDPAAFAEALLSGELQSAGASGAGGITDALMGLRAPTTAAVHDSDSDDDANVPGSWPTIPAPQSVVRMPPVNWAQYAVVGDALDKMHADQVARPADGWPALARPDHTGRLTVDDSRPAPAGTFTAGGGAREATIAAPYTPGRDKIERPKEPKHRS